MAARRSCAFRGTGLRSGGWEQVIGLPVAAEREGRTVLKGGQVLTTWDLEQYLRS